MCLRVRVRVLLVPVVAAHRMSSTPASTVARAHERVPFTVLVAVVAVVALVALVVVVAVLPAAGWQAVVLSLLAVAVWLRLRSDAGVSLQSLIIGSHNISWPTPMSHVQHDVQRAVHARFLIGICMC